MNLKDNYLQPPISNGNPHEQALIRKWWYEAEHGKGEIVWEYFLEGYYADAIWFVDSPNDGKESPGKDANTRFPIKDENIVLCEAKLTFRPELLGQAIVYRSLLRKAGARVERTVLFPGESNPVLEAVAVELGIDVA